MHGRTYKQAFTGKADFTGIYELKQHVNIPVICNGDVMSYEDGILKIMHPENRRSLASVISTESPESVATTRDLALEAVNTEQNSELKDRVFHKDLD